MQNHFIVGLIGNPNCGKTTLFNALTGAKQRVGNWPGVTVERKSGYYKHTNCDVEVIDLPGTYSLDVVDHAISLDEMVARQYMQQGDADLIINIVDAANLERNLYLTSQLADMGVPLLVVLNMLDVAQANGTQINIQQLEHELGCPVVPVVASEGRGIAELKAAITQAARAPIRPALGVKYDTRIETAITQIEQSLIRHQPEHANARWLAIRLIEGDKIAHETTNSASSMLAKELAAELGEDLDLMMADARYGLANKICTAAIKTQGRVARDTTDRIDRVVLNRILGIPIFLLMMYLMFMLTINLGGAFIDFFDMTAAALFVDGFGELLRTIGAPEWLTVLLASGIGGGMQTVATFIPIIGVLYLFLSVLEDSGYMARAAFVMDRFMRWVGLPGKSFVPLIVGFGCNVPAIMATRTLEHQRDRLLTIAMAPFMSCGARLPVYVLFAAAFFPSNAQNVVFGLYLIGIAAAILTGLVLKNSLLKGEATPFIMELPPYHMPTLRGVLIHTWDRLKGFVIRAGRIIVPMVLVLNFLNALGTDGTFGHEDSKSSVLAEVGRTISPAFSPFGLNAENWPAAVGIFTGILAKEAVVGTLNATYESLAKSDALERGESTEPEEAFNLFMALSEAIATIPANLLDALETWADPLGINVGDLTDQQTVSEEQDVSVSTFGAMAERFDGAAGAFAYLLFILLYFPCTAATAAVYQESGARWMFFVVAWTTGLGYGLATIWYQAANYVRDPVSAAAWIVGVAFAFFAAFAAMHRHGKNNTVAATPVAQSA
ncbi:MAG: Fe(2+) transporter permease subunit FeoB [Burkholderiaceae bacterium]|nr:Fe(2+) transporter permease subunit FeoB [Burkholderiaceae bacterium]MCD8537062.1 Fe(2+) transporter permease subunit FeoB [Burkholderiaceae bacterium]